MVNVNCLAIAANLSQTGRKTRWLCRTMIQRHRKIVVPWWAMVSLSIFVPISTNKKEVSYRPTLLREAKVHFSSRKYGIDGSRFIRFVNAIEKQGINWDDGIPCLLPIKALDDHPSQGCKYMELPGYAMNSSNYKQVEKDFSDYIYRNERVEIFFCPMFKSYSRLGKARGPSGVGSPNRHGNCGTIL